MTQRTCFAALSMVLAWLLLAGCAPSATRGAPLTETPAPPGATTTRTAVAGNAAETNTPQPSPTLTASITPLPSHTPTRTPTPTATVLACWDDGGRMELGQLETELLSEALEFRVYLPPCYEAQAERRYPVLYLIHGQSYNDDQWDRLGADETANRLVGTGELAPFLIVMPRDRAWSQPDADPFGQAVLEVLLPYIDETYRTVPERQFRAVGGLSRGASWAIHFGFKYWQLFGAVGGHSPPVFWADVPHMKRWLDEIPADELPRIFLDIGENDRQEIKESAVWFEQLLTQRNIPHDWYMFSGYHDETYWQAHVEQYLRWYAQDW